MKEIRIEIPKSAFPSLLVSGNATRLLEVVGASRLPARKRHLAFLAPLVGPRLARLGVGDVPWRVGVGLGLLLSFKVFILLLLKIFFIS